MTFKDGKYYCDKSDCPSPEIKKGTGFSFPEPNYHMHQSCYRRTIIDAGTILGKTDRDIRRTLSDADELVKAHKKLMKGEITK